MKSRIKKIYISILFLMFVCVLGGFSSNVFAGCIADCPDPSQGTCPAECRICLKCSVPTDSPPACSASSCSVWERIENPFSGDININSSIDDDAPPAQYMIDGERALRMSGRDGSLRDIYIGKNAGGLAPNSTNAYGNVFIGRDAGSKMVAGGVNTMLGDKAGESLASGKHNTIIGSGANDFACNAKWSKEESYVECDPYDSTNTTYNTMVGSLAGRFNVGKYNNYFGTEAGRDISTGQGNIMIGVASGSGHYSDWNGTIKKLITGSHNVHLGFMTQAADTDLHHTIALGDRSLVTASNQMVVGTRLKANIYTDSTDADCDGTYDIVKTGEKWPDLVCFPIGYEEVQDGCPEGGVKRQYIVTGCGTYDGHISESYWGSGVTSPVPLPFTLNATGGYGDDVGGADLVLAGGKSTGSAIGGSLKFQTAPAGTSSGTTANDPVERMIIDSNGNVGIGTPTPGANLDISVDSTTQGAILRLSNVHWDNDAAQQIGAIEFYRNENDTGSLVLAKIEAVSRSIGDWDGELAFYTGRGEMGEAMRIDRDGNVGIGTSDPTEELTVSGVISSSEGFKFPDGTVQTTASVLGVTDSSNSFYGQDAGNNSTGVSNTFIGQGSGYLNATGIGNVFLGYQAGYNETSSNKLYIANSSTSSPLVYGDFSSGYLQIIGDLYVSGNTYVDSDLKLKDTIEPIGKSLEKVLNLTGVSFQWKKEEKTDSGLHKKKHYGVIAQDVEKVLPEIVKEDTDGKKKVAYMELIPVLIEAVKEQQKTITELSVKVQNLEKELKMKDTMAMVGPNLR